MKPINQLRDWLDLPAIVINQDQCLNYKSNKMVCDRCQEVCPTQAIEVRDHHVYLSEKACIECSACLICPVMAIEFMPKEYSHTVNEIKAYPGVDITCNQFEKYQKGIKIPCYRYIDPDMLMSFLRVKYIDRKYKKIAEARKASGQDQAEDQADVFDSATYSSQEKAIIHLYTGHCQTCKFQTHYDIQDHLSYLKDWCYSLGINLEIREIDNPDYYLQKQGETVAASGISRRDLIRGLGLSRKEEAPDPEAEAKAKIGPDYLDYDARNIYKRLLLNAGLDIYRDLLINENNKDKLMPRETFALVTKADKCNKCNICSHVCPTKALIWDDKGDEARQIFYPELCIACARCTICPIGSIGLTNIDNRTYQSGAIVLDQLSIKHCEKCKQTFIDRGDDQETCQICTLSEQKRRAIFDSL